MDAQRPLQSCLSTCFYDTDDDSSKCTNVAEEECHTSNHDSLQLIVPTDRRMKLPWKIVVNVLVPFSDSDKITSHPSLCLDDGVKLVVYKTRAKTIQYKCQGFRCYGCTYQAKIHLNLVNSNKCTVYSCGQHDHSTISNKKQQGLPIHVKASLLEAGKFHCDAENAYRVILREEHNHTFKFTQEQVSRHMLNLKKKKTQLTMQDNSIGSLYMYLEQHELKADSPAHSFGVLPGWQAEGPNNVDDEAANVFFVCTTLALLQQLVHQANGPQEQFFATDATYNLIDRNFPALCIGTVNCKHEFKRVALCVSRHENEEAFAAMFKTISICLHKFFNFHWRPVASAPDSAGAIHNAMKSVFVPLEEDMYDGIFPATCYFHNKQALKNNKYRFGSQDNYEAFVMDVEKLHSITNSSFFNLAVPLFQSKWERREPQACDWYMQYWGNTAFHAGATPVGLPVTNNALERDNRTIKDFITDHHRLSINQFLHSTEIEMVHISKEAHRLGFDYTFPNDRPEWINAQVWLRGVLTALSAVKTIPQSTTDKTCYYVPSSNYLLKKPKPTLKDIRQDNFSCKDGSQVYKRERFDQYLERIGAFYTLHLLSKPFNEENWFMCNCVYYFKYMKCKHSLGLSIHFQKTMVPPQYKRNSIAALKEKGRPAKVKA